jgi:hypothetical protein
VVFDNRLAEVFDQVRSDQRVWHRHLFRYCVIQLGHTGHISDSGCLKLNDNHIYLCIFVFRIFLCSGCRRYIDSKEDPRPHITNPHNQLLILASLSALLPSCDRRPDETFNLQWARHDFSRMDDARCMRGAFSTRVFEGLPFGVSDKLNVGPICVIFMELHCSNHGTSAGLRGLSDGQVNVIPLKAYRYQSSTF